MKYNSEIGVLNAMPNTFGFYSLCMYSLFILHVCVCMCVSVCVKVKELRPVLEAYTYMESLNLLFHSSTVMRNSILISMI